MGPLTGLPVDLGRLDCLYQICQKAEAWLFSSRIPLRLTFQPSIILRRGQVLSKTLDYAD
jgi:hypothetical protein